MTSNTVPIVWRLGTGVAVSAGSGVDVDGSTVGVGYSAASPGSHKILSAVTSTTWRTNTWPTSAGSLSGAPTKLRFTGPNGSSSRAMRTK